jgi:hypothetical protein
VKMDQESRELAVAGLKMLAYCQLEMSRRERLAKRNQYTGVIREPRVRYQVNRGEFGLLNLVRDVFRGWHKPRS